MAGSTNGDDESADNRMLFILDELEGRVSTFRKDANTLESEKNYLRSALDMLKKSKELIGLTTGEKEDIEVKVAHLQKRLDTVIIAVGTPRDPSQEMALNKALGYMDQCQEELESNMDHSHQRIQSMSNACALEDESIDGPVDYKFQSLILGCAADDQKMIRKRLLAWKEALLTLKKDLQGS